MPTCPIVQPEDETLPVSGDNWIRVRKRLTHGDREKSFARRYSVLGGNVVPNLEQQTGMAKITAYLLAWSFVDLEGKVIPIAGKNGLPDLQKIEDAVNSFHDDVFDDILGAINAHEAKMAAERKAEKNGQGGGKASPGISPSPFDVTGGTSGSSS